MTDDVDMSDVCVCIPTLNEAATVGRVIDEFYDAGAEHILVIDGNSTDDTRDIAREKDAEVLLQTGVGKGQAVKQAVEYTDYPYIVLVDGDATYEPNHLEDMVRPLKEQGVDHVIGNRFADLKPGALTRLNYAGNRIINTAFRVVHRRNFKDILSGYRAFTRESFKSYMLTADGFGIETEMAAESARNRSDVAVVPTSYSPRPDGSSTNLNPFKDGLRIMFTLYRLSRTNNPLFYFGSLGGSALATGSALTAYVLYEWLNRGVSHEVVAIGAAAAILLGVQLLAFALLADMNVALHDGLRTYIDARVDAEKTPSDGKTVQETAPESIDSTDT